MNTVLVLIAVCVFVCLPCFNGQLVINLNNGDVTGSADGVSTPYLKKGFPDLPCSKKTTVKLTFVPGVRERAVITMKFAATGAEGWTFDLGDSVTNHGLGQDRDTQDNDAEVHSINSTLYFFARDPEPWRDGAMLLAEPNFVGVTRNLTLEVKDQQVRANNGQSIVHVRDYDLFQLNGQYDRRGVNYDLYLALNQVIEGFGSTRTGRGLCLVTIQFFPS